MPREITKRETTEFILSFLRNYNFLYSFIIFQTVSRLALSIYALFFTQISIRSLPAIFALGLVSDLVAAAYLMPMLLILIYILKLLLQKPVRIYRASLVGFTIYAAILILIAAAELVFWDEYGTKFNFIAVDYLIYTQEIIHTLKDSLPIVPILSAMLFLALLVTYLFKKKLRHSANNIRPTMNFLFVGLSLVLSLVFSKFYNSEATFFSSNRYANELTLNGPYEFVKAFLNNSLDYNKFYTTLPDAEALKIIRQEVAQNNQKFISDEGIYRYTRGNSLKEKNPEKKYNVILLTIESLSAEFVNYYGSTRSITPNIDELISQSLVFDNIYAVGTRTVRGLEASTLSIPPTPGSSIVRRPGSDNLFNTGTIFKQKGYDIKFIYGGYSYFDNLKGFFGGNGFDIIDRSDLKAEEISFSNIWGVADEDILKKALEVADESNKTNKPFFQLIMTTSNHRPYSFPENRIDLPSGGGRFAAVKYTDYAIGQFIKEAQKRPWFDKTIFIITADHCASSAGKTSLPVNKYHIPLLIYAPKLIKPAQNNTLASQIDIMPTVFGLMNFDYSSKFYGKDIISSAPNRALISTYQLLGFLRNSKLAILSPDKLPELYKTENDNLVQTDSDSILIKEAISYYQTAYKFYSEGRLKVEEIQP